MAVVALIFGGTAGFVSALVALILFNASWLFAFALWSMGGIAIAATLVVLALALRTGAHGFEPEHA